MAPFLAFFMGARKCGNIICDGKCTCCARNSNCERNLALEDCKACEALWSKTAKDLHFTVVKPGPRTLKQGLWFRALKLAKRMHKFFIRNDR